MGGDAGLKSISKRMKANGLGRLRYYCQMCEKQCRDENGFKCHTQTVAHQEKLVLFASQPELFVDRFSDTFLAGFLAILQQRYGSNAVEANTAYQEYIKDKQHVHMNATRWTTLTEFVKDLGRKGIVRVEDRDGKLWVTFVDRDVMERKHRAEEMERARLNEEEAAENALALQMEAAKPDESERNGVIVQPGKIETIDLSVGERAPRADKRESKPGNVFKSLSSTKVSVESGAVSRKRRKQRNNRLSALDEIMSHGQKQSTSTHAHSSPSKPAEVSNHATKMDRTESNSPWLRAGIVVKIIGAQFEGKPLYKQKGIVESLVSPRRATVRMTKSGLVEEVGEENLQTVIPKAGGPVVFVRGLHLGKEAVLEKLEQQSYTATVSLLDSGETVSAVEYEDISKLHKDE